MGTHTYNNQYNILMQYFERSKLVPKTYDEQNIKFLSKDRIKTSATQSHVGATGKRKNHCDPEASSSLTSSCKRLIGSLQDLLRFHDWHTLITITLYWPKQVIGSTQFPGIGKKQLLLMGGAQNHVSEGVKSWGIFASVHSFHWQHTRGSTGSGLLSLHQHKRLNETVF